MQCIYVRLEVQLVKIARCKEAHTLIIFLTTLPPHFFAINLKKMFYIGHPLCQVHFLVTGGFYLREPATRS